MRSTVLLALTPLVFCCADGRPKADEPKSATPAEELQTIIKAQRQAQEDFSKAYNAAKTDEDRQRVLKEAGVKASPNSDYYAEKFLALIRNHPKDPAALDAFRQMLARMRHSPQSREAAKLIIDNWIQDERLADVCKSLIYYSCDEGDTILRAAIDKSPHRNVQGYARFSLALSLKYRADGMANSLPAEREPFEREAEQLFQQVIDKYADLKHITSLGREAEAHLFELRHLAIGRVAPELDGEDLDGKPMKLSDYRGKIVLLDFWGSW